MAISISVIIPTHNRPKLLSRSMCSVINQTEKIDEIIIVDDANSKETQELVDYFNLSYIRYVKNEKHGVSSSRNLGIHKASSDFIAFLDDDDEWLKDKIQLQKSFIKKNELDACFSRMFVRYEDKNIEYSTRSTLPDNPKIEICIENFIGATSSSLIRRDLLLQLGGFDINFPAREEYDLWIRLIHNGAKIGIIEKPLVFSYRSLKTRLRISSNIESYVMAIKILNEKHEKLVEETLTEEQLIFRKRKQYEFLAAQAATIGLRSDTIKYYLMSLKDKFSLKILIMIIITFINPILLLHFRTLIK
jgi:glycosyltransferase involved in cell wall biosynthesis